MGFAVGSTKERIVSPERGFQLYTVLLEYMTSPIPDTISYEAAIAIPIATSTAACGMFQDDQLGLQIPNDPPRKPTGKTLIVWGGSTSVGCSAIQLGVTAGYDIITTASPKNFVYVKRLGESQALDYNSKTIVADVVQACRGRTVVGAITIDNGGADACMDILPHCQGEKKFISMASFPLPEKQPRHFVILTIVAYYLLWTIAFWINSKKRGIHTGVILGSSLVGNGVGKAIYADFLPVALERGTFVPAPESLLLWGRVWSVYKRLSICTRRAYRLRKWWYLYKGVIQHSCLFVIVL